MEQPTNGISLAPYQVVLRPLVTEKNVRVSDKQNQYAFEVHSMATKEDIKHAIEELFNVKVAKVRTQTKAGKPRRSRFKATHTKPWKKAIVALQSEFRIDFF